MNQQLICRKESIILEAIDAIDKYGIQGVSTREIAKKLGVTERVIFNNFPKKSDLILAIIYFIDCYSTYYENYSAITAISQSYDILQNNPEFSDKVKGIFHNHAEFIKNQIEESKRSGQIRSDFYSGNGNSRST